MPGTMPAWAAPVFTRAGLLVLAVFAAGCWVGSLATGTLVLAVIKAATRQRPAIEGEA